MPVIEPKTREEYEKAVADAKGPVVVEFTQNGCGHCDPAAMNKLATDCGSNATLLRLECSEGFGADVADQFKVDGTPTALFAGKAADWKPGVAVEVDPESSALRRKLKCALPKKGE